MSERTEGEENTEFRSEQERRRKGYQRSVQATQHNDNNNTSVRQPTSYKPHSSLLPISVITRIRPTPPIRQETQPLLKRPVPIAVRIPIAIPSRTAWPTIHTRPPVEQAQAPTARAPSATLLSRVAATALFEAAAAIRLLLLLTALLVQTAAKGTDGAALQERQRAPATSSESRFGLGSFFGGDGRFVRYRAFAGLPAVGAKVFCCRGRGDVGEVHDVELAWEEEGEFVLEGGFEAGHELGAGGGVG